MLILTVLKHYLLSYNRFPIPFAWRNIPRNPLMNAFSVGPHIPAHRLPQVPALREDCAGVNNLGFNTPNQN